MKVICARKFVVLIDVLEMSGLFFIDIEMLLYVFLLDVYWYFYEI